MSALNRKNNKRTRSSTIYDLTNPSTYPPLLQTSTEISNSTGYSTEQILEEFRRFMALKFCCKDTDATIISPTPIMDLMWHAAILNTKYYDQLQEEYGMKIHHNPDGASLEPEETNKRVKRLTEMKKLYEIFWNEEPLENKSIDIVKGEEKTALFIKTLTGKTCTIYLSLNSTVLMLKEAIQRLEEKGVPVDEQRLIFAGKQLENSQTLKYYNIDNECTIHLVKSMRGC